MQVLPAETKEGDGESKSDTQSMRKPSMYGGDIDTSPRKFSPRRTGMAGGSRPSMNKAQKARFSVFGGRAKRLSQTDHYRQSMTMGHWSTGVGDAHISGKEGTWKGFGVFRSGWGGRGGGGGGGAARWGGGGGYCNFPRVFVPCLRTRGRYLRRKDSNVSCEGNRCEGRPSWFSVSVAVELLEFLPACTWREQRGAGGGRRRGAPGSYLCSR